MTLLSLVRFTLLALAPSALAIAQTLTLTAFSNAQSHITASTVDPAGDVYIAGFTTDANLPVTAGAFQSTFVGSTCGFIQGPPVRTVPCPHGFAAKIDAAGTRLLYATYLGGESADSVAAIAVDTSGNLYLTGKTQSTTFPVTPGAWRTTLEGTGDSGFIAKLAPAGNALNFSTYIPGGQGTAIAVDRVGSAFVGGIASGLAFQATPGAFQTQRFAAHEDAFVMKLSPDGTAPAYATLIGGSYADIARAIAIDSNGNAYVGGYTASTSTFSQSGDVLFPITPGAFSGGARTDVFIAKLNVSGSALLYSAVFGGSGDDDLEALAVDTEGAAYFAGFTAFSPDFPTTPGAFQTSYGGGFAGKLSPDGSRLLYSTYLGTARLDRVTRIAINAAGSALVGGFSNRSNFPTTPDADQPCVPYPPSSTSTSNEFVARLDPAGGRLLYSSYAGSVVALDPSGLYYFTPVTSGLVRRVSASSSGTPAPRCITNAASFAPGPIAPGEIVTLFGPAIGPDQPAGTLVDDQGRVTSTLSGVHVTIGGLAAPLLYVSKNQINAVAPFEIDGQTTATVEVLRNGVALPQLVVEVASAHPAFFALDGSGYGGAAALNQDGSVNSAQNPAQTGSIVSLFLTGLGAMAPALPDGSVPQSPVSKPVLPVRVALDGAPAFEPVYVGNAPALVQGAIQVNAQLPATGQNGQVSIYVMAGDFQMDHSGQITVWVK